MSTNPVDEWQPWIQRNPSIARVTPDALAQALEGFPMEPKQGMVWLARAIQGALLFTFPLMEENSHPETGTSCVIKLPNGTQAKKIYQDIADSATDLFASILHHDELLRHQLLTPERYLEILGQAEEIAAIFRVAAADAKPRKPRSRQKRVRRDRIDMATALSPIFEQAFDRKPAVINRPGSDIGPWPDFFQRILALVLGEEKTNDLAGVLKRARKLDRLNRVTFAPGQIPE